MGILKKAVNEQAFLKAGILGFPGSGKTYTATMLAIGLSGGKPVAFFDTETGSDFLIPRFETEKIELLRVKSQAFADLLSAAREAEKECGVLIVDSITHVWRELCDSYARKKRVTRLTFADWGVIKPMWAEWTNFFLNSKFHIIVCGRAGYEYEDSVNEDGKREISKVGTKMKVESEFGFEPSLLIEMERAERSAKAGSGWIHRAHVLKDRTDTINGLSFDFQKIHKTYKKGDWRVVYKPFAPALDSLNPNAEHFGLDTTRTSEGLFNGDGETTRSQRMKQVTIALEEIQGTLVALWPGQDAESKKIKQTVIESIFNTRSWTAVESRSLEELEAAVKALRRFEEKNTGEKGIESILALLDQCRNGDAKQVDLGELPESFNPKVEQ